MHTSLQQPLVQYMGITHLYQFFQSPKGIYAEIVDKSRGIVHKVDSIAKSLQRAVPIALQSTSEEQQLLWMFNNGYSAYLRKKELEFYPGLLGGMKKNESEVAEKEPSSQSHYVHAMTINTDQTKGVIALRDGTFAAYDEKGIKIWNAKGECVQSIETEVKEIDMLTELKDGTLMSENDDGMKAWDRASGRCLGSWRGDGFIEFENGNLAFYVVGGFIRIWEWNIQGGKEIQTIVEGPVKPPVLLKNGTLAFLRSEDNFALYDPESDSTRVIQEPEPHVHGIKIFGCSNGNVAILFKDQLKIWMASKDKWIPTIRLSVPPAPPPPKGGRELHPGSKYVRPELFPSFCLGMIELEDGSLVCYGRDFANIWESDSGRCTYLPHDRHFTKIKDNAYTYEDETTLYLRLANGNTLTLLYKKGQKSIKVYPCKNGNFVTLSKEAIQVWDSTNGECLQTLENVNKASLSLKELEDGSFTIWSEDWLGIWTLDHSSNDFWTVVGSPSAMMAMAASRGCTMELKHLLSQIVDVNAEVSVDKKCNTPLALASAGGHLEAMKLLLGAGAYVDIRAFKAAIDHNQDAAVELLAERGDVNVADDLGKTALHHACRRARSEGTVRLLLDRGARVDLASRNGKTALAELMDRHDNFDLGARERPAFMALLLYIVALLIDRGADVNAPMNYGKTIIQYAIDSYLHNNHPNALSLEIIRLMIHVRGANINALTARDLPILQTAVLDRRLDLVRELRLAGIPFDRRAFMTAFCRCDTQFMSAILWG